jgi:hypothetical protein
VVLDGLRFYHARIVDGGLEQLAGCLSGHDDLPAIRPDQSAVLDQGFDGPLIDDDTHQPVACHIKGDGIAARQGHSAHVGDDDAIVGDLCAKQSDIAAVRGRDGALIKDAVVAAAGKFVVSSHEVSIGDALG